MQLCGRSAFQSSLVAASGLLASAASQSKKATPSVREPVLAVLVRLAARPPLAAARPTAEPASSQIAAGQAPNAAGRQPDDASIRRPAAARWACLKSSVRRGGAAAKRLALADKQSAGGGRDAVLDAPTEHGPHNSQGPGRPAHLLLRGRAFTKSADATCKTAAQDPALAPVPLPRAKKC